MYQITLTIRRNKVTATLNIVTASPDQAGIERYIRALIEATVDTDVTPEPVIQPITVTPCEPCGQDLPSGWELPEHIEGVPETNPYRSWPFERQAML